MKPFLSKLTSIIIMPILFLIALVAWLGGAGGGPKTLIGALIGCVVLFLIGVPVLVACGALMLVFFLITLTSRGFKKRMKAMEKTLKGE